MRADLEANIVTNATIERLPEEVIQEVLRFVVSIQYGSVEILIHDEKVVQIESREKIRVNQGKLRHKPSESQP